MSIELHVWPTPNGYKVSIALEEMGLPYTVHPVNIGAGDQFKPDFLKIAPNNRMPAIVDPDGPGGKPLSLFESGAILIYLAEKTGQFRPNDSAEWFSHLQWLMWQMGGVGPMFGQAGHFILYAAEKVPYGIERYRNEAKRLLKVANTRLTETQYLGSDAYGIADMATFPWIRNAGKYDIDLAEFPQVKRWFDSIAARPAVQRGLALLADKVRPAGQPMSDEERANLYGRKP
ncbi:MULTISPECIES: glutathione S-transferase N-terminal domain-containing protein [unclassified Azospirillum]|uniref:glutathione S-transferase N-terminal domain-containing protein n=1 Tax=unclassified Azospirillum TaxID=2630922 RepID=UPI000B6E3B6A|nr:MULTISPECIES: glutathione S-transferase N-terminal domain-containing protein [unclassified Azospirillum]SNR98282.1 GST-like protein [Azospirillum sp. RU38E]SNS15516.1 GST-like protein [Azospirillum sp. RU37A]